MSQAQFLPSEDQLIKFLYEEMDICNWAVIASKVSQQAGTKRTIQQCKQRYSQKLERYLSVYNPQISKGWKIHEERQLYKLHDQFGNKWATIANHLIGRTDNCVKNHLYSKLRKSLRTLNKIVKICFKKQLKEISTTVLYKLTEATQQNFNKEPGVENYLIQISQRLKSGLLQYEIEDSDIVKTNDYQRQKQFIKELLAFNKDYKKKTKRDKTGTSSYTQNIKKALQKKREIHKKNEQNEHYEHYQQYQVKSQYQSSIKNTIKSECQQSNKNQVKSQYQEGAFINQNYSQYSESYSEKPFQNSQKKIKKLKNFLIKAPTTQQQNQYIKSPVKQKTSGIEDILKIQGILQNGQEHVPTFLKKQNSQRALSSRRSSFSNISQSSYGDMFGDDFNGNLKQLSEMENDSEIFQKSQP